MNRGYSDKTHELILRMERANLANPQPWDKENVLIALCKSYKAADIEFPKKVVVCMNLTDKRFLGAARAAGAAGVAGAAWAAERDYQFDRLILRMSANEPRDEPIAFNRQKQMVPA